MFPSWEFILIYTLANRAGCMLGKQNKLAGWMLGAGA
jgi:hypothetical protein